MERPNDLNNIASEPSPVFIPVSAMLFFPGRFLPDFLDSFRKGSFCVTAGTASGLGKLERLSVCGDLPKIARKFRRVVSNDWMHRYLYGGVSISPPDKLGQAFGVLADALQVFSHFPRWRGFFPQRDVH